MRGRTFLCVSVGLNAVLAMALAVAARRSAPASPDPPAPAAHESEPEPKPRSATVVRQELFDWNQLESPDYATYVANLRSVQCPEQTLRDIIIADVNQVFAEKRAALGQSDTDLQWWKKTPSEDTSEFDEQVRAMWRERRELLNQLLGKGWDKSKSALAEPLHLGGPVLSGLSKETKQQLEAITQRLAERKKEAGEKPSEPGDPIIDPLSGLPVALQRELVQLEQQARVEMAALLTPQQLEEFELRNSPAAELVRNRIPDDFNVTPEEFRQIYRKFGLTGFGSTETPSEDGSVPSDDFDSRLDAAMRSTLGETRFAELEKLNDSNYREAMNLAEEYSNASPATLQALYDINKAAEAENERVSSNTDWTDLQREIATKRVELAQLEAHARALGQPLPAAASSETTPVVEPSTDSAPPSNPPASASYIVRAGDTLARIASVYQVPAEAILNANPGLHPMQLRIGQHLTIPTAPPLPR